MSTIARRLRVHGRVQGVNYRGWVRDRAASRGVHGWATNEADGSVDVWLEGEPDAVASVERAVGEGPSHARVERVDASDVEPRGLDGFARR
jgi:acylphosphatase